MPNFRLSAGPNKDFPAFLPSPEPLGLLLKGLTSGTSTTSRSGKSSSTDADSFDNKLLPGASGDYKLQKMFIEAKYKNSQAAIIKESRESGDTYAQFYKDNLGRIKQNELDYRLANIETDKFLAEGEQQKTRYKEIGAKLDDANVTGDALLYDDKGQVGIEAPVEGGRLYTRKQWDHYNINKGLKDPFLSVSAPDYNYFDKKKDAIFSGLGVDDIDAAYIEIRDGWTPGADGELVPVRTTLSKGNGYTAGQQISNNARSLFAAINEWNVLLDSDTELARVNNIKRANWEKRSKEDKAGRTFDDFFVANMIQKKSNPKTIGGIKRDFSKEVTKGLSAGALHAVTSGKIQPTGPVSKQVVQTPNGEYLMGEVMNPQWYLGKGAYSKSNAMLSGSLKNGTPVIPSELTPINYYYYKGVPQKMNELTEADAIVIDYTGRVTHMVKPRVVDGEYLPPKSTSNTVPQFKTSPDGNVSSSGISTVIDNIRIPLGPIGLGGRDRPERKSQVVKNVIGERIYTQSVRVFVPTGGGNAFTHSDGFKRLSNSLKVYDNAFSLESEDPNKIPFRELSDTEKKGYGFKGEDNWFELIIDIPFDDIVPTGDNADQYYELLEAQNRRDQIEEDLKTDQAFNQARLLGSGTQSQQPDYGRGQGMFQK